MWIKSAMLLKVRVKVHGRKGFSFPVPFWVVDIFMEALTDLAWVGELALKLVPAPQTEKAGKHLYWIKRVSPSGIITILHGLLRDLGKYKGLDVVDVETGDVQVKISLK